MLTSLKITNFVIVKTLELDFKEGMTAFTGETGAGKSIMIDALTLAMGGRGDASVVRSGEEKCTIEAVFTLGDQPQPLAWLAEQDISIEEGEIILRRSINTEGRSKSWLNGQWLPLQKIREFSEFLVHIHGQHQHQTLLQHTTHRQQLDQFAGHEALLAQMHDCYKAYTHTQRAIEKLQEGQQEASQLQLLEFQLNELEQLNLRAGELEELDQEHQLLHHAKDYLHNAQTIHSLLHGDETENLCQNLHQVLQRLHKLPASHSAVQTSMDLIQNAIIQCEESAHEMARFAEAVQLDPQRLQQLEERLSQLHTAARKYQVTPDALLALKIELQQKHDGLQQRQAQLAQWQQQAARQAKDCEHAAAVLHEARQKQAQKLGAAITAIIQQLGMPQGKITVELSPLERIHAHGNDRIEYKACTNPGTRPDSLAKIASGGELSRISLAIQMITAQQGATPTLLFDEVDVGIGGATAALVGKLLRELGQRLQVFCVTHQPQVAACAHQHFRVEKHSEQQQTFSRITALQAEERTEEIARMLGGLHVSEQSRHAAREMLAQAGSDAIPEQARAVVSLTDAL
ncbi:MAG: DNA repair protein RecN [Legionellaceae bacterium]|nr:DNA repair protein RecN [Legionellaceae bacterium]